LRHPREAVEGGGSKKRSCGRRTPVFPGSKPPTKIAPAVNSFSPPRRIDPRSGQRGENRIRSKRRTARRLVVEAQPQKGRPQAWI